MKVTYLGQAGLLFERDNFKIMIDPYLSDSVEKINPKNYRRVPVDESYLKLKPDVMIFTHNHLDHYDPETVVHFIDENSTYINEKKYCEENGINAAFVKCESQEEIHAKTLEDIARDDCSDFIFPIYEFPDSAGHGTGFSTFNPEYQKAMYDNDIYAGEVIEAIKARKNYENEDWLIILTSDHGGFVTSHGGLTIQERMTFIVINKEIEL